MDLNYKKIEEFVREAGNIMLEADFSRDIVHSKHES